MRWRAAACGVVIAFAAACPPQADLVGKECTSLGECPARLFCVAGHCRADHCDPDQEGVPCSAGQGACLGTGSWTCDAGQPFCTAVPKDGGAELCNGIDDDCDGVTDNAPFDVGNLCAAGVGACLRMGPTICVDAGIVCPVAAGDAGVELANGVDDDCDGFVDDGVLSTVAGAPPIGKDNGAGDQASFAVPYGMVADRQGDVFVADQVNHRVRRIVTANSPPTVSTTAGRDRCGADDGPPATATFCQPFDLDLAPNGDLYVVDGLNDLVRVVHAPRTAGRTIETVDAGFSLSNIRGIHAQADGGVWVVLNTLHIVRALNVRDGMGGPLIVGNGLGGTSEQGWANVQLSSPIDVVEHDGVLYVSERHRIRGIPLDGGQSFTLAGYRDAGAGSSNGVGEAAGFSSPAQLVLDLDAGRLLVVDTGNNSVRAVPLDRTSPTTTVAGNVNGAGGFLNAPARFTATHGIALLPAGDAVISDQTHRVRHLGLRDGGAVTDFVGGDWARRSTDGPALMARLAFVGAGGTHLVRLNDGSGLAWYETSFAAVRKLTSDGQVVTLVGPDAGMIDGPFGTASMQSPRDLAAGPGATLYVVDSTTAVRALDLDAGTVTTLTLDGGLLGMFDTVGAVGTGQAPGGRPLLYVSGTQAGAAQLARVLLPSGPVTIFPWDGGLPIQALLGDSDGGVYVSEFSAAASRVAYMDFAGNVNHARFLPGGNTNAGTMAFDGPRAIVYPSATSIFRVSLDAVLADGGVPSATRVFLAPQGYSDGAPPDGALMAVSGIAVDGERWYLLDAQANRIRLLLAPR